MSLMPPFVIREPEFSQVTLAERVIYRTFIRHLESGTSDLRAGIRTAAECGVSRTRVAEVIRKVNEEETAGGFSGDPGRSQNPG